MFFLHPPGMILGYCENNYKEDITLESVAKSLNISPSHISHMFTKKIRMSFRDYINSLRLGTALNLLKQGEKSITEIARNRDLKQYALLTGHFGRSFILLRWSTKNKISNIFKKSLHYIVLGDIIVLTEIERVG